MLTILRSAALSAAMMTAVQAQFASPQVQSGLVCPAESAMARRELVFGMSRADGSALSDADWGSFLEGEVTPRFPEGMTVLTGYGQWRNTAGDIRKETSKMLIIWHRPSPEADRKIEEIRTLFKARFQQESVMRVDGMSCVSF